MKSRTEVPCLPYIKEGSFAFHEENMALVVWGAAIPWVCMVVLNGPKARHGERKDPYPIVFMKYGEDHMYGYKVSTHDGTGFFRAPGINAFVDAGWDRNTAGLISDPLVYIYWPGLNNGVHGCGAGCGSPVWVCVKLPLWRRALVCISSSNDIG